MVICSSEVENNVIDVLDVEIDVEIALIDAEIDVIVGNVILFVLSCMFVHCYWPPAHYT